MNAAAVLAAVRIAVAGHAPERATLVFTSTVKAEMATENVTDLAVGGVLRYGEVVDEAVQEDAPDAWRCVMQVSGDALRVEIGLQVEGSEVTVSVIGIELEPGFEP